MRSFANLCIVIGVTFIVAIATKPADQDIRKQVIEHYAGRGVVADLIASSSVGSVVLSIEDFGCYKAIYNRVDGSRIGFALFGRVIFAA